MEDKKPGRLVGSKVSQIANIFQSMAPGKEDNAHLVGGARTPDSPKLSRKEDPFRDVPKESMTVTVVRTESHLARFNNARAMFEKLGEENQKVVHLRSPGSIAPKSLTDRRSRSSSANSSDGNSTSPSRNKRIPSRSPSPSHRNSLLNGHDGTNHIGNNKNSNKIEGTKQNSVGKDNKVKENEWLIDTTNPVKKAFSDYPKIIEKPERQEKPEKPEKPERKINNLIEKQKNWPSHFSNRRSSPKGHCEQRNSFGEVKPMQNGKTAKAESETLNCFITPKLQSAVSPTSHVPYNVSPSPSMVSSQEEKQEKEIQEKVSLIGKFLIQLNYVYKFKWDRFLRWSISCMFKANTLYFYLKFILACEISELKKNLEINY